MVRRFFSFVDVLHAHEAARTAAELGWSVSGPKTHDGYEGERFFEVEVFREFDDPTGVEQAVAELAAALPEQK